MRQRSTLTFFIIVLLNSMVVKSYVQSDTQNVLKIHSSSRKIDSGLRKHVWNVDSNNSPGSKEIGGYYDIPEKEERNYFGRIKRRLICARHEAMQKRKRRSNHQQFRHEIKHYSEQENLGREIGIALLCNYERVKREMRKINVTLAPQAEMETNFQIIIDSELAKAILQRLSILSSSKISEEETTTSISMSIKDNDKEDGMMEGHPDKTDVINESEPETESAEENETEEQSMTITEATPEDDLTSEENSEAASDSADQEIEQSTVPPAEEESTQPSVDEEIELSTIFSAEQEEESSTLPPVETQTIIIEEGLDGDNSTKEQIDVNADNSFKCNFTAYQEMKLQCKGADDATEEGEGLPCSITGLWVSDAGGVQLDIKTSNSRGYLDVLAHDLTPPRKGFLSPSWRVVGQLPFLDMDGNVKRSDQAESQAEDSLGGIFSLTATVPGASSETGEKQLAIFIGECHVCEGGMDTIVGTWSLKRPSKSCRDALLSLQEIRDVLHRDILSESIKSKSRRMVNVQSNRAHRGRLHRRTFRRF